MPPVSRDAASGRRAIAVLALALTGLAVSAYLLVDHYTAAAPLACPEGTVVNCQRVTTSPQSTFLGLPVALLGVAFFVAVVAVSRPAAWRGLAPWAARARAGLVAAGVVSVIYLVYAELFLVNAICLWCTVVHVVALALFAVVAVDLAADPDQLRSPIAGPRFARTGSRRL